jgi:tartrate-resistant acid phosphatase type 5
MLARPLPLLGLSVVALAVACGGTDDASAPASGEPTSVGAPSDPAPSGEAPGPGAGEDAGAGGGSGGEAAPKSVRFVAMGDTGTGSVAQKKIANAISAKCQKDGCDFVQLLGDNLYQSGASSVDDPIWDEKFEIPYAAIDLDFWAVLGNHDYGHDGAGTDFPKGKVQIDYTQKSKKWKMPAAYYQKTFGDLEIFGLDTNMQMFGQDAAQKTAMKGWIGASIATWKIAVGHHPYKSNGPHGNAGSYDNIPISGPWTGKGVKDFMDEVVCGKVDLYLSGHDHSRQWLNVSCQGTELAVSGAGAKATKLTGNNPVLFQSLELGFLYLVAADKTLTCEFVDEDGNVEFTHVISK